MHARALVFRGTRASARELHRPPVLAIVWGAIVGAGIYIRHASIAQGLGVPYVETGGSGLPAGFSVFAARSPTRSSRCEFQEPGVSICSYG